MIILPEQNAVFVGIPRTGSMSMSQWLERGLRGGGASPYPVEALHDWHANIPEAFEAVDGQYPLYRMWSFAVVRNPYDRLVSWCAFSDPEFQMNPQASLRNALEADFVRWTLPQTHFTDGVQKIYHYESLDEAVREIRQRLAVPDSVEFEHEHESERGHYRDYYGPELRKLVADRYASDLATFNYRF